MGRAGASMLSGFAAIAVMVSLGLAAQAAPAGAAGGSPPPLYITANIVHGHAMVFTHSSATGRTLSSIKLPGAPGGYATVAAARSSR